MRDKKAPKRLGEEDKMYQSKLVQKFINKIMKDGKKSVAQKVVYQTFDLIKAKDQDPLNLFEKALQTVAPKLEVKARRVGGANYQIPTEVRGERKTSLAMKWILAAATARPSKEYHSFAKKLAAELLDAVENRGEAVKKRDSVLRMAEANKAFSHFRW